MNEKNVILREDKRYEIRFHYGYKNNGTSSYKSVYGKTKQETIDNYNKKIKELESNKDLLIYDKSYIGYDIYNFLNNTNIRNKKSTNTNYLYMLNSKIIPYFANIKKKNISLDIINSFTNKLIDDGLSPKTIKDILVMLKQILNIGDIHIKITMPKVPKKEIEVLTNKELEKLEEYIVNNLDNTTLSIYLSLYTGLRIGELCGLKWDNIDLKDKRIFIDKTLIRVKNNEQNARRKTRVILDTPKSESSIREIPIPNFLIPLLKEYSKNVTLETYLTTGTEQYVETRTHSNRYKSILKKLELPNYKYHALRHTFATRCIEDGCDPKTLSQILGHSSVKITLEKYVHPSYDNKVKMMNRLKPKYTKK